MAVSKQGLVGVAGAVALALGWSVLAGCGTANNEVEVVNDLSDAEIALVGYWANKSGDERMIFCADYIVAGKEKVREIVESTLTQVDPDTYVAFFDKKCFVE